MKLRYKGLELNVSARFIVAISCLLTAISTLYRIHF